MNGKGSRQRPCDLKRYGYGYDLAFGKTSSSSRRRALAAIQSAVYARLRDERVQSHTELVSFTGASPEDVSIVLQALKGRRQATYLPRLKKWRFK